MLGTWLRRPHVQAWWRDGAPQAAVEAKYRPRISRDEPTEVFIAVVDGVDAGMIQRYRLGGYPAWEAAIGAVVDAAAAAGIDYLLGDPVDIGRGVGTTMIGSFSTRLFDDWADVGSIVVTPQADNRASCRALERAGYRLAWTGDLASDDPGDAGPSALYVLRRRASPDVRP
jgi:RimJ/RimL family protein N-acetyltransferase